MKQFALRVTTLSLLSIRSDQSPNGTDVAPYIPGSTLMGSLAAAHSRLRGDQNEFVSLFLSNKVRYPNLYPESFQSNKNFQKIFSPIYCIPRTAQTCKRFKGFLSLHDDDDELDPDRHGVRDSLFDWAIFALQTRAKQSTTDEKKREHIISTLEEKSNRVCICGEPLDRFTGYYRWRGNDRAVAQAGTRLLTRTGINRKYGTIEETILYNREAYEEHNKFFGIIQVEDDIADTFQNFIEQRESKEDGSLLLTEFARLGTARTRGFGQVEFEMELFQDEQNTLEMFEKRLRSFDQALRDRAPNVPHYPFYLAITLHAPVLLYDDLLRYEGTISAQQLATLTKASPGSFELLYYSASVQRIMGWQELWGLPRSQDYALSPGSVFLFALTQPLNTTLVQTLFEIEGLGIGHRRDEGFGRICISDPFHKERELR